MTMNKFLSFLCSMPIILILLYFIPFIGICLLFVRCLVYRKTNKTSPAMLIILGIVILIPKFINFILGVLSVNKSSIPYFEDIINSSIYNVDFIKYSKLLIIVGILYIILSYIAKMLFSSAKEAGMNYIKRQEQRDAEISRENDLIMKEKRLKAANGHVVKCSRCGSDNLLTEPTGICKYCRNPIK